jgi:hypothetical protein
MPVADFEKVRARLQFIREAVRQLEQIRARGRESLLGDPILQAGFSQRDRGRRTMISQPLALREE